MTNADAETVNSTEDLQDQENAQNTENEAPEVQDIDPQAMNVEQARQQPSVEEQLTAEKDRALRAYAELENFKRRKEQEIDNIRKYAAEKVISAFLPIIDDLERANGHLSEENEHHKPLIDGFGMIQKQVNTALEKLDVTEINPVGEKLDPHQHQAIMQEDAEGTEADTVLKVMQKGYKLKDRVIRPAMVVVAK